MTGQEFEAGKELSEYNELIDILGSDCAHCEKQWRSDPSNQFNRRSYVRAGFAYVEGHVFKLKQWALGLDDYKQGLRARYGPNPYVDSTMFSFGERLVLSEESFEVDDKGEVYSQSRFVRLDKNIKFAFRAISRAHDIEFKLDLGDSGWGDFKKAIEIRNRITHPKSVSELSLSNAEMETTHNGFSWYLGAVAKWMEARTKVFDERTALQKLAAGGTN